MPAHHIDLLAVPELAQTLGVPVTRVHQYLRDGQLVALRDDEGVRRIPARFVRDGELLKSLAGVITVLRDARFADTEIIDWLFRADDTLPGGTPIDALHANHTTEVRRRAQVAGF